MISDNMIIKQLYMNIIVLFLFSFIIKDVNCIVIPGIETMATSTSKTERLHNFIELHKGSCGQRVDNTTTPFIVKGVSAKYGEFPWHVGIYRQTRELNTPEYICGGSILNGNTILTVAHCFTDDNGKLQNETEFFVGAAKQHRDFLSEYDKFAQRRKIEKIVIHPKYKGLLLSYAWDIAVIFLNASFEFSNIVQPICVDWKSNFEDDQLKFNSYGQVAGWGHTEKDLNKTDDNLKVLSVPYVDHNSCTKVVPKAFIKYITMDKFCAGYQNGSSVCTGDSGSGLVFGRTENDKTKYYIRGLVSVGVQQKGVCDSYKYSTYTKVSEYLSFIQSSVPETTSPKEKN